MVTAPLKTLRITGSPWWVALGAFRKEPGDPRRLVAAVTEAAHPAQIQIVDAGGVAGLSHLYLASVNAARSLEAGSAVSRSLPVETLLTLSCNDQIARALETHGVKEDTRGVAVAVFAPSQPEAEEAYRRSGEAVGEEDDSLLDASPEKLRALKRMFGVTDAELEAIGGSPSDALTLALVERGALLGLSR